MVYFLGKTSSMASPSFLLVSYIAFSLSASFSPSMWVQAQSSTPAQTPAPLSTINKPTSTPADIATVTSAVVPPPGSSWSSTPTGVQTHTIQVGFADHKFKPDNVKASLGDVVEFQFYPSNHSVVRAEQNLPCIPIEMTGPNKTGFYSGFHYVETVTEHPPTWQLTINDTSPQFFYCSAPGSCTKYGMVGIINPNASTSIDRQRTIALASDYELSPGEPFPAEGIPSSTPSTPPSNPPSAAASHSTSKISTGVIAGIVIACVGVVVLGGLLVFFWSRFCGLRDEMKRKDSTILRTFSPRSPRFWPGSAANTRPQSQYIPTPMSSHAKPGFDHLPPTYYPSPTSTPGPVSASAAISTPGTGAGYPYPPPGTATTTSELPSAPPSTAAGSRLSRSASHRSMGGTFDVSPKGYYRTQESASTGIESFKAPHTSDMTSPTDPSIIPVGPYGRQMMDLQRIARSEDGMLRERGYFETANGRPETYHINQRYGPVEMDDTSRKTGNFI